jgi:hypothetical protein
MREDARLVVYEHLLAETAKIAEVVEMRARNARQA